MDTETLAAELRDDPLGRGYAGMSDAEAAAALNAVDRPGKRDVPIREVRGYALLRGLWPAIEDARSGPGNAVQRGAARSGVALMTLQEGVDFRKPEIEAAFGQQLQALVDAGAITADDRVAILALGNAVVSRAQELGLAPVHHLDVARAREAG